MEKNSVKIKLDGVFSNNSVIQQNQPFTVRGICEKNQTVYGRIKGKTRVEVQAYSNDEGEFLLNFPPIRGGFSEYSIEIECCNNAVSVNGVVFGDVYLFSGQSNMEYQLEYIEDCEKEHAKGGNEYIRFLNVESVSLYQDGGPFFGLKEKADEFRFFYEWKTTKELETAKKCSGFAFMFASNLFKKTGVPIGIVNTSVGGSSIEAHILEEGIEKEESLSFFKERIIHRKNYSSVGGIYNEKIHPMRFVKLKGCIWYLGESSAWDKTLAEKYEYGLDYLVKSYRKIFGEDLAFLLVHIGVEYYGNYYGVNFVNRSISRVASKNKFVVECPIYDLSHSWFKRDKKTLYHPIHITAKTESAIRASELYYDGLLAKSRDISPLFKGVEINADYIDVVFSNVGLGIRSTDGKPLYGFTIANSEGVFCEAEAEIVDADRIRVFAKEIKNPTAVAYAFALYNNSCNVGNDKYPLVPFVSLENVDESKLAQLYPALSCRNKFQFETTFGCNSGGAWNIPTWSVGRLFASDGVEVTVGDSGVLIEYKDLSPNYYYLGASCKLDIANLPNIHVGKERVEIELVSKNEIEFSGYHVHLCDGRRLYFGVEESGKARVGVKIKANEKKIIAVSLNKALNFVDGEIAVDENILKSISYGQFTFRDFEGYGEITITKVRFY